MPSDLELRALLKIEADTRGADQTRAALRGVQAEAAQVQKATFGSQYTTEQSDAGKKAFAAMAAAPKGAGKVFEGGVGQPIAPAVLDRIRTGVAAGGDRKAAEELLTRLGADAATIAAVTGTGKTGAPVPPAAVPGAHPAAAAAPRGPGGASLKQTADDAEKVGKSFHLTASEAVRFGTSMVGLGIGLSAFSLAGRLAHDALAGIIDVGLTAERQARETAVAFGQEAAGMTAFAQSVRAGSGFTKDSILSAAGAARQLVSDGKLSEKQLEDLVRVGAEYAQITGGDVTQVTATLAGVLAHGGDAASTLGLSLGDASVAARAANGKFAETFKALSDGQQTQVRFVELIRQAADAAPQAAKETTQLAGSVRNLGTSIKEAVDAGPLLDVLNAIAAAGAAFIQNNTKGITENKRSAAETDAAFAQAREEVLANTGATDQLQTAQGRLAISSQIEARAQELLAQKHQEAAAAAVAQSDREHRGAELAVTDAQRAAAAAAAIPSNRYPQQYAQAQSQVQSITYAIGLAQRENLDLTLSETHAQQDLLGPKRDLLDIEYQINRATDARLGLIDQERVLRAQMAAQGAEDALQDAQTTERRLGLMASIRGPGRGAARAELRRFDRAQTVQRAELTAIDAERPVTLAQRTARDDAAAQQLRLLPLQQIQAGEQRVLDQRQHEVDLINLAREADKLRADEFVNGLTRMQRAAQDAEEAARKAAAFAQPGGTSLPWSDQRNAAFALPGDPAAGRAGMSVSVQITQQITGDVSGADTALLKQVADDSGAAAASAVVAAWRQAQQGASMPSRSTEAGAR